MQKDTAEFRKELEQLLNRHSMDNYTNTPDFLLADMLCAQVITIREANKTRDKWHGFKPMTPWDE